MAVEAGRAAERFAAASSRLSAVLALLALAMLGLPFLVLVPALSLLSRHADQQPLLAVPIVLFTLLALGFAARYAYLLQLRRVLAAYEGMRENALCSLRELSPQSSPDELAGLVSSRPEHYLRMIAPQLDGFELPGWLDLALSLLASALCGLLDPWRDRLLRQYAVFAVVSELALAAADAQAGGLDSGRPGG